MPSVPDGSLPPLVKLILFDTTTGMPGVTHHLDEHGKSLGPYPVPCSPDTNSKDLFMDPLPLSDSAKSTLTVLAIPLPVRVIPLTLPTLNGYAISFPDDVNVIIFIAQT